MLKGLLGKVVGDPNEREIRRLQPLLEAINALEPDMERRTDAEFRSLTERFRAQLASGDAGTGSAQAAQEGLEGLLVEAFAAVREAAKRTVDMRPFDVQLIGAIVLHRGMVAEMRTGEGKTLVATMPIYLNALLGRGVHLVTVNDYLARRDVLWMGPIYHLMGLSAGLLQSGSEQPAYLYDPAYQRDPYPGLRPVPRREAYKADVTYGTNNEFGFDYLRDNLALALERRVQRPLYYAIVDEVDNIFIDEARTPLIISGPSGEPVEEYSRFAAIARRLESGVHYELDEKERSVYLSDEGLAVVEQETGIENIYDEANYRYVHYMQQALKAQVIFQEGRDYIRQRKRIVLIDQHTGRLMPDRRLSEGLHQAIEAKEGAPIRPRDVTSATVTIQNYFRMYEKLAGMSGTAVTEGEEFFKIYSLDVLAIPTNQPVARVDHADVVYRSEEAKLRAVAREILACHCQGQPVLVGTTSVEMSERLSTRLTGERLQMATMAPRVAYALQDGGLERDERSSLRETMDTSLETINSAAWRRMMRSLDLDQNMLSSDSLRWMVDYLDLPDSPELRRTLERALRDGIPHQILNAKEHTREATIIARAGEPGTVTIATNMAGRGVDIKLGGDLSDETIHRAHATLRTRGLDPFAATQAQMDSAIAEVEPQYAKRRDKVLVVGGLHILGTERHEARRIDNQLRGRSGRQGEPGSSRFYLSLEDDLMRRFGRREMLSRLMEQIGDDFPIEHGLVSKTIERAQTAVEGHNFDIRKHLLEYDDVLNRQRETIYDERMRILRSDDLRPEVWRMLESQVDEYLEKASEGTEQQQVLFAGLDDVVPLILPAPNAPFQGPVAFGSHLTAFPPFTISFIADRLAGEPLDSVEETLRALARQAASSYGEQLSQTVSEIGRDILDKYDERLDRYRALLDEKIEDFLQLLEERGQPIDPRRLAQHLERTYPLKLSTAPGLFSTSLDDMRDHWVDQIEVEFHRQTCIGLLERTQIRLPADALRSLDRVRPARIPPAKLSEEVRRVLDLAAKQPVDGDARQLLAQLAPPSEARPEQVLGFINTIKKASNLEFGRLDRLVGHVLGAYLDDLLARYQEAADEDEVRLQRSLERLRRSIDEGKQGGRSDLLGVLRELSDLVHLEISDMEELLGQAVAHEYDKWAQRQLTEMEADARRTPLADTSWDSISEHLLASHYTQKQAYDRDHRRRTTWAPRLPFGFLARALVDDMDPDVLRTAILTSLRWASEQREQVWGQQEVQRWGNLSLDDLDRETYARLLRYLGEQELGDQRELRVEDLPRDLYDHLLFILALRPLEDRRLGNLPHADDLLAQLGEALRSQLLDTPVGELDAELRAHIHDHLRKTGHMDNAAARAKLVEQPIHDWDRRTWEEAAAFWGQRLVEAYKDKPVADLPPQAREMAIDYLQGQRRFVDEERVQRFLVHEGLSDLTVEPRQAALEHLARTRLDRLSRRKISNLDVTTRQVVTESLQRLGLFTDRGLRKELLSRSLEELEPAVREGVGACLARERLGSEGNLNDLEASSRDLVIDQLKQSDLLADPQRIDELPRQRLDEVDDTLAARVRAELADRLHADLETKSMEELPAETRQAVRRELDERDYFVDQEKASWYERKTLAQLPSDVILGLEEYLGQIRLAALAETTFRELPPETREALLTFFDEEGLLGDRAERLRLTQTGRLADLVEPERAAVVRHLGRNWFVQIRDRRPPDLPEKDRRTVWIYLREQGTFADEFKEELFALQRLDEFGADTQQAVERTLLDRQIKELESSPVGNLPPGVQATIKKHLREASYFLDEARLQEVVGSPVQSLPADVRKAIEASLGNHLLAGLDTRPIGELPDEVQAVLWRYLDQIGYLVDETKRSQLLDRRLADLGSEHYEPVVRDLALHLEAEISDQPVSELEEDLRQGLREALEATGYFESDQERAQTLNQPLGRLRREDLEAIAAGLGRIRLESWADRRLSDLPEGDSEALLSHLQANDWFLDRDWLERLDQQRLRDLEISDDRDESAAIRQDLVAALERHQMERLRLRRLADLDRGKRRTVRRILREQGLSLEEGRKRSLHPQRVHELDPDVYDALLRDLGSQVVAAWPEARFQDLPAGERALLGAYLGRQIMGRIERRVLLHTISRLWIDYLTDIEDLRRGIGLEAYGQRDPLVEYKRRAFELFEELGDNIRRTVVRSLFRHQPEPLATQ